MPERIKKFTRDHATSLTLFALAAASGTTLGARLITRDTNATTYGQEQSVAGAIHDIDDVPSNLRSPQLSQARELLVGEEVRLKQDPDYDTSKNLKKDENRTEILLGGVTFLCGFMGTFALSSEMQNTENRRRGIIHFE